MATSTKDKQREYAARYRKRHPDRIRASKKRWSEANGERLRMAAQRHRASNPESHRRAVEKHRKANLKQAAARLKRWREQNPDHQIRKAASDSLRKARKRGASIVGSVDRELLWLRDRGICGICGEPAQHGNFHVDHRIPLARGGEHSYRNCQVAHPACNIGKGARTYR